MEHTYDHHLKHAHHSGIIIGAVAGSCAVTFIAAFALVLARPQIVLNPLKVTSQLTSNSQESAPSQPAATTVLNEAFMGTQPSGVVSTLLQLQSR